MKIWAYSKQTGKTELVDTCNQKEACFMVREYQVAFGLVSSVITRGYAVVFAMKRRTTNVKGETCER